MIVLQGDRSHGEDWELSLVTAAPLSPGGVDASADGLTTARAGAPGSFTNPDQAIGKSHDAL